MSECDWGGSTPVNYKSLYTTPITWGNNHLTINTTGKIVGLFMTNNSSAGMMMVFHPDTSKVDYYYDNRYNTQFDCTVTDTSFTINANNPVSSWSSWRCYYVYESNE